MMSLFKVLFKNTSLYGTNKGFRIFQIGTAALQSFTHGTNDAQKAMGIITMALIAAELQTTDDIQLMGTNCRSNCNGTWYIHWWL